MGVTQPHVVINVIIKRLCLLQVLCQIPLIKKCYLYLYTSFYSLQKPSSCNAFNSFLPLIQLVSSLLSLQGRRGSDSNRRSADYKGDVGSGRCIPIKQVRHRFALVTETNLKYLITLSRGHLTISHFKTLKPFSSCGVMKCCDLSFWPDE